MAETPRPPPATGADEPRTGGLRLRTGAVLLVAALAFLAWFVADVLLVIFAGLLLAVGVDAIARGIAGRTPLSRGWALLAVWLLLTVAAALFVWAVVPQLIDQFDRLWTRLQEVVAQVRTTLAEFEWGERILDAEDGGLLPEFGDMAGQAATATLGVLNFVGAVIILLAIAVFAAAQPGLYRRGVQMLFPPPRRRRVDEVLSSIAYALRWWFLGQLASMLMLGATVGVGLFLIGVDLWLPLALLTALLTFIPFLGPIIAGFPVVIVSFAEGAQIGLIVLAFYLVVQTVEGHFITPLIQQQAVRLPPVLLIGVQVLLGTLFGVLGLILAAPLTVVGIVLVQRLYVEDVLGDR